MTSGALSPVAITREPSASLAACELSFLDRQPIDLDRARVQHAGYCAALAEAGCQVVTLPALDALPDAVFVEDTAVVLDELAVLARPAVLSRAAEVESMAEVLASRRPLHRLSPQATLDGGDVLRIGRKLYVGRSRRTNLHAIVELEERLHPLGYDVRSVRVDGCLHLKTGCTYVGQRTILIHPRWVDSRPFANDGWTVIPVPATEPWAANTLPVNGAVFLPAGNPKTRALLEQLGVIVRQVDISEVQKAEAGLTCLSLLVGSQ